jgi:hypothetical protein
MGDFFPNLPESGKLFFSHKNAKKRELLFIFVESFCKRLFIDYHIRTDMSNRQGKLIAYLGSRGVKITKNLAQTKVSPPELEEILFSASIYIGAGFSGRARE